MLHAIEIWHLTKTNLQHNDRVIIRQICSIKPEDVATVRSSELLAKLDLEDLDLILRERRLCWFGHVEGSSGAVRTACDIQIYSRQWAGRPKLTWKKLTEKDCREWMLTTVDPQERSTCRSRVRSAMGAASQIPGGPLMWMMPLHMHVNKKSDYDDMIMTEQYIICLIHYFEAVSLKKVSLKFLNSGIILKTPPM